MQSSSNLQQGGDSSRDVEEAIDVPSQSPNHQHNSDDRTIPQSQESQPDQRTEPVDPVQGINPAKSAEIETVIVLSFRSLRLQRIAQLQDDLLVLAARDTAGNAPPHHSEHVDKALDAYARALRNYETLSLHALPEVPTGATLVGSILSTTTTISEPSRNSLRRLLARSFNRAAERFPIIKVYLQSFLEFVQLYGSFLDVMIAMDPFSSLHVWNVVHLLLTSATAGMGVTPSQLMEAVQQNVGNLGFRELDPLGRQKRSQKAALTQRIVMAMFGGVALITPMLIMTLHSSRNVSLVTTSLATFIFALILAFGATESAGKDVLAATAAYAAVLVVFVGTNTAGS